MVKHNRCFVQAQLYNTCIKKKKKENVLFLLCPERHVVKIILLLPGVCLRWSGKKNENIFAMVVNTFTVS